MTQRELNVKAGDFMRSSWYPVRRSASGHRRRKAQPTAEVQAALNEKNRQNQFADLLYCNFTPNGLFLTLTYRDECMPQSAKEAQRFIQNFFRRVNAWLKKHGLVNAKYLYITERGEKSGRIHHHVFIECGMERDELEKAWGKGYANSRRLEFDENGLMGLVKYSLKSGVQKPDEDGEKVGYRTWSGSKNLAKPKRRQNDYRIRAKDAAYVDSYPDDYAYIERLYPGYRVARVETTPRSVLGEPEKSPIPRAHFITIWLYKADTKLFGLRRAEKRNGRSKKSNR